jgi:AhpD family alkylhydroperoxidase
MSARLKYAKEDLPAARAMFALEQFVHQSGLEPSLLELVRLRASLINGCAYCIDMHTTDALRAGETQQRLSLVSVWREAESFYTERERAALEWTEAVTLVAQTHVPDEVYARVKPHFTDEELVNLTMAIITINGWNRLSISFRAEPDYSRKLAEKEQAK